MSELPKKRTRTDILDSVGNTTATGKGLLLLQQHSSFFICSVCNITGIDGINILKPLAMLFGWMIPVVFCFSHEFWESSYGYGV
jgi:hypothetical protein